MSYGNFYCPYNEEEEEEIRHQQMLDEWAWYEYEEYLKDKELDQYDICIYDDFISDINEYPVVEDCDLISIEGVFDWETIREVFDCNGNEESSRSEPVS
jgi:hypothetical protein